MHRYVAVAAFVAVKLAVAILLAIAVVVVVVIVAQPAAAQSASADARAIEEWQERATKATRAGQDFVKEFTNSKGCEPGQRQVVNRSQSGTRTSFQYEDDPRLQNRRRINRPNADHTGLRRIGPSIRFFSESYSQRREVCK
jgi:hypothetical protein